MFAIIFHRLGPYHFARLRAAGSQLSITAIESSGRDETYAWDKVAGISGFDRVVLFKDADAQKQPAREVAQQVALALDKIQPAVVVVPGWADSAALGALHWCVQHQVPAVFMSESTAWDERRSVWREAVKRQIVRLGSAALVGGTPHKDYLVQLGMPPQRVFQGYDAVDNGYFLEQADTLKTDKLKGEVRRKHGLPENYFLASNRFIEKKNLPRLIEAYARYRLLCGDHQTSDNQTTDSRQSEVSRQKSVAGSPVVAWPLVLLGDGALRPDLCRRIADLGLQDSVRLPGFKQYPELPEYYAHAGAFIHASTTEQWGLVVNEAMASGLPVLVSNRCGCAQDLVHEGVNGFTFDPCNVEQLAGLMLKLSTLNSQLSTMGDASRRIIANWGPDRFASGLKQAVECALRVGPPPASLAGRLLLSILLNR